MENVEIAESFLQPLFAAMILGCGVVLSVVLLCKFSFKPSWFSQKLFPCESRIPIHWGFLDVCVIFFLSIFLSVFFAGLTQNFLLPAAEQNMKSKADLQILDESVEVGHEDLRNEHPLTILMALGKKKPYILLICFVMAVIAAPLCEEFLFRVILQGCLQSFEEFLRHRFLAFFMWIPRGFISVFIVALFFSLIHWREPASETTLNPDFLFYHITSQITANFATVLLGITYLTVFRNVTLKELGFVPKSSDFQRTAIVYLMIIVPMFMIQIALKSLAPEMVADPITLMVLAMTLGILFFRTNRFFPAFLLHMIFNGVSFSLLLLFL